MGSDFKVLINYYIKVYNNNNNKLKGEYIFY